MKTVLVVGGTDMLGLSVARKLNENGCRVRVLTRDIDKARLMMASDFEFVQGDVRQKETVSKALENCYEVHISLNDRPTPQSYDWIEYQGSATIARLAREAGVERLTYLLGDWVAEKNTWFMETLDLFVNGKHSVLSKRKIKQTLIQILSII